MAQLAGMAGSAIFILGNGFMPKKVREWGRWPVPSDWDEEADGYMCYMLCVPNSRRWRGIFVGQVDDIAYGRNYNRETGVITDAQLIAREIFESMCAIKCDDLLTAIECICEGVSGLVDQGESEGSAVSESLSDGDVAVGPGEQFPNQETYFNAKCSAANGIYDTVLEMSDWLDANNVDLLAGSFGGMTSGLLLGLTLSGPVGWATAVVTGVLSGVAGFLVAYSVNFEDLTDALVDTHDECVLSLYNASSSIEAENNFIAALEAGTPTVTSFETNLVRLYMTAEMLNQLFEPRDDLVAYVSPDPVDCGGAVLEVWTFASGLEAWTFADESDPGSSATRSYNSAEEAIQNEYIVQSAPNVTAWGVNTSPAVSHALTPGASIQVDYAAPSDEPHPHGMNVIVVWSDATEGETGVMPFTGAGTRVLTVGVSKTVVNVRIECGRSTSGTAHGTTSQQDFLEVRIVGL